MAALAFKNRTSFIYVLEGEVTLVTDAAGRHWRPAGSRFGRQGDGHQLINEPTGPRLSGTPATATAGDGASYSDVDLAAHWWTANGSTRTRTEALQVSIVHQERSLIDPKNRIDGSRTFS